MSATLRVILRALLGGFFLLVTIDCVSAQTLPSTGVFSTGYSVAFSPTGPQASANMLALASADPSSGTIRSSLPVTLNKARGSVQPSLGLYYSSVNGNREAGVGWGLELPSIERRNLSGPPGYTDPAQLL